MKKAGTTALHHHLEKTLGLCVARCTSPGEGCGNCLYGAPDCQCTDAPSKQRFADYQCYPCNHIGHFEIKRRFEHLVKSVEGGQHSWLQKTNGGYNNLLGVQSAAPQLYLNHTL